jgi:hypothetical protein
MDTVAAFAYLPSNHVLPWLLLYIGPDVFLPLASALAAVVGVILMFWQRLSGWVRSLWRTVFRRMA